MRILQLVAAMAMFCIAGGAAVPARADAFGTKEEAVALVHRAIAHVAEVGMAKAAPEFMDRDGKFFDRDLYLIIIDKAGIRVVHGQNPKLVGKTYYDAIDVNDKPYGKEVQQIAEGPGKGWFSFTFKDPITGKLLPKDNYVERAGDYTYLSGAYRR
jgi:signal transduction histidine kinase